MKKRDRPEWFRAGAEVILSYSEGLALSTPIVARLTRIDRVTPAGIAYLSKDGVGFGFRLVCAGTSARDKPPNGSMRFPRTIAPTTAENLIHYRDELDHYSRRVAHKEARRAEVAREHEEKESRRAALRSTLESILHREGHSYLERAALQWAINQTGKDWE